MKPLLKLAIKILVGNKSKYISLILGLAFATLIVTQQSSIFIGLIARTYAFIGDTSQGDIWVMNNQVEFVDDVKMMKSSDLNRVRSVEGIKWAVPIYKGIVNTTLLNGNIQSCVLVGIDNATLIGGPPIMVSGKIEDLRQTNGLIVDETGAREKLFHTDSKGNKIPAALGDELEINGKRAVIVGSCKVSRTFQFQPRLYMTFENALQVIPKQRNNLTFILAKSLPGEDKKLLCKKIKERTGLAAYDGKEFETLTLKYYMKNTGIPINFGIAVLLGLIIGASIAGQTFYSFVLDNIPTLATFKAMGASDKTIVLMTLVQVVFVGTIGWGLGIGAASLFGLLLRGTELSFYLHWKLLLASGLLNLLICALASFLSLKAIFKLEPAQVLRR